MIIEERGKTKEGFEYIIGVHVSLGHRLGYVGVYPESPLHSKCYSEDKDDEGEYTGIEYDVHVHGGLTFSGILNEYVIGGMNRHYFGFDCAHLDDAKIDPDDMEKIYKKFCTRKSKSELALMNNNYKMIYAISIGLNTGDIKTRDFVRNECFHLSAQLKELEDDYADV